MHPQPILKMHFNYYLILSFWFIYKSEESIDWIPVRPLPLLLIRQSVIRIRLCFLNLLSSNINFLQPKSLHFSWNRIFFQSSQLTTSRIRTSYLLLWSLLKSQVLTSYSKHIRLVILSIIFRFHDTVLNTLTSYSIILSITKICFYEVIVRRCFFTHLWKSRCMWQLYSIRL